MYNDNTFFYDNIFMDAQYGYIIIYIFCTISWKRFLYKLNPSHILRNKHYFLNNVWKLKINQLIIKTYDMKHYNGRVTMGNIPYVPVFCQTFFFINLGGICCMMSEVIHVRFFQYLFIKNLFSGYCAHKHRLVNKSHGENKHCQ